LLERLHEALCVGIAVRIPDAAHARLDVVPVPQRGVVAPRILPTPRSEWWIRLPGPGLRDASAIMIQPAR
jgi:hypothetical protein